MHPALDNDGHEIVSPMAIIVPPETDGSAMMDLRIVPVIVDFHRSPYPPM